VHACSIVVVFAAYLGRVAGIENQWDGVVRTGFKVFVDSFIASLDRATAGIGERYRHRNDFDGARIRGESSAAALHRNDGPIRVETIPEKVASPHRVVDREDAQKQCRNQTPERRYHAPSQSQDEGPAQAGLQAVPTLIGQSPLRCHGTCRPDASVAARITAAHKPGADVALLTAEATRI
jgi:hypothetical protein